MSLLNPKPAGRFGSAYLFRPESVAVVGAGTAAGAQVLANLLAAGFQGVILPVDAARLSVGGVLAYKDVASLPITPELAVIASEGEAVAADAAALAARGTFAAIVLAWTDALGEISRRTGVRLLGPGSFGLAVPAIGLNATRGHLVPRPGHLALVSQSSALCRAVLDWAEPNGVGFSHVVGVGGNADVGFATVLDWLSRDPGTGAILLDIRHIRDPRAFLSGARAAARLRPVVAIRAGGRLLDPSGEADLVLEAALRRAGVLSVSRFDDLLAAAETLTRAKPVRGEGLAIVTNSINFGQLAAGAALRDGLPLATLAESTLQALRATLPADRRVQADRPVHVGTDAPARLAAVAGVLGGAPEVGGVLAVHAPTGAGEAAAIAELAGGAAKLRVPLLVAVLGETTAAAHRQHLAGAGVPAFETPEQAVRGFLHLIQDRRNRAAARELPPSTVLAITPDRTTVQRLFADARAAGRLALAPDEWARVLAAYGIAAGPAADSDGEGDLLIRVVEDATFGPAIGFGRSGPGTEMLRDMVLDLPPLNLPLARGLVSRAPLAAPLDPAHLEALAETLVRVSQLVVDFPEIAEVTLRPVLAGADRVMVTDAIIRLHDAADRKSRLAIAPYPAELVQEWTTRDETLTIRPVRPEDAEQHGAMFRRLSPEDVRFRFFSAMRALSPEQIARMTQVDYDREMAFIAVRPSMGETVGVSRLVCEPDLRSGEFAVVVQPDVKGKGVAGRLMQCLIDWARSRGVATIVGQILADNAPMLGFARHLGFTLHRLPGEDDVVEARLTLDGRS